MQYLLVLKTVRQKTLMFYLNKCCIYNIYRIGIYVICIFYQFVINSNESYMQQRSNNCLRTFLHNSIPEYYCTVVLLMLKHTVMYNMGVSDCVTQVDIINNWLFSVKTVLFRLNDS